MTRSPAESGEQEAFPSELLPPTDADPRSAGPYRLVGRIGAGGMGVVHAGVDDRDACVAVKMVHRVYAADPEFRARFAREVKLVRRVRAACVPAFRGADVRAETPWLATEYVPGPTLRAHLEEHGPLPGPALVAFAAGTAEALAAIHAAGVVHRDLKPGNVILSPTGPKVLDFGIARAADETALTATGALIGTAGWIAPEQYRGQNATDRSDMFAWAALVAFAATGRNPHGGGTSEVVAARILGEPPDLAGVSETLRPVLASALGKDPAGRPTAAEALAAVTALPGATGPAASGSGADADVASLLRSAWNGIPVPEHRPRQWALHAPPSRPWTARHRRAVSAGAAVLGSTLLAATAAWALSTAEPGAAGDGPGTAEEGENRPAAETETDGVPEAQVIPEEYRRMFDNGHVVARVEPGAAPRIVGAMHPPVSMSGSGLEPMDRIRVTFEEVDATGEAMEFTLGVEYLLDFGSLEIRGDEFPLGTALYSDQARVETVLPEERGPVAEVHPGAPEATIVLRFPGAPDTGVLYHLPEDADSSSSGGDAEVFWDHPAGFCYSAGSAEEDFADAPGFSEHRTDHEEAAEWETYVDEDGWTQVVPDDRPPGVTNSCIYRPR